MHTLDSIQTQFQDILNTARQQGVEADIFLTSSTSLSVSCRLGSLENLERSESQEVGIRVLKGNRQAIASSKDLDNKTLLATFQQALDMAHLVPEDPYAGLPVLAPISGTLACDTQELTTEQLTALALEAEQSALDVTGITNSLGASCSWGKGFRLLMNTAGFVGHEYDSSYSLSAMVIGQKDEEMQRDYAYTHTTFLDNLKKPKAIGQEAARRTLEKLAPQKPATQALTIVFDPRVAPQLLQHFVEWLNGTSVGRNVSLLKDKMGQAVTAPSITIMDNPLLEKGLASRLFDDEGTPSKPLTLVDQGILAHWILHERSARQLGLKTTGHAHRSVSSVPAVGSTNLMIMPGSLSPDALMNDIHEGIYVTELMGFGFNASDGSLSQGATGFRIRNGALAEPLHEFTVAGNLLDMFHHMTPANDLVFDSIINTPTLRVEGMMVAGQ